MRQESHRVYWYQRGEAPLPRGSRNSIPDETGIDQSIHQIQPITSSANIRISEAARAQDVTQLIRQTLNFPKLPTSNDALVLVGTVKDRSIRFEHQAPSSPTLVAKELSSEHALRLSPSEPVHIVRTLLIDDSPLVVRDRLLEYLHENYSSNTNKSQGSTAPHLQWFFVPGSEPSGNIPNFLDLDGYCTDMDSDDENDKEHNNESEEGSRENDDDNGEEWIGAAQYGMDQQPPPQPLLLPPWKLPEASSIQKSHFFHSNQQHKDTPIFPEEKRLFARERRKNMQLSHCKSVLGERYCVSGFLLKRCPRDKHVWKRVYCSLTNDDFWYVSRYYERICTSRHWRIELTRAFMCEAFPALPEPSIADSSASTTPVGQIMSRIPFCFELVSSNGTSHVFRAMTDALHKRWMACLKQRIVQCQENNLLEHAELIVGDETVARNKRLTKVALPNTLLLTSDMDCHTTINNGDVYRQQTNIMVAVRFGMEVAEYRERCRHIQAALPAKSAVVVGAVAASPTSSSSDLESSLENEAPLDQEIQDMVKAAWGTASTLLTRATQVALCIPGGSLRPSSDEGTRRLCSGVETLCRHVDYVITGQFRSLSKNGEFVDTKGPQADLCQDDPPPGNLFDPLLAKLQDLAESSMESKSINQSLNGSSSSRTTNGGEHSN